MRSTVILILVVASMSAARGDGSAPGADPLDPGTRRELFVDDLLIAQLEGAQLRLHHPVPAGVALRLDKPWEGAQSAYVTVLQDGDRYRMYYRAQPSENDYHGVTAIAESCDGIKWTRPNLGLWEVQGTRENNVVLKLGNGACVRGHVGEWLRHNFTPFLDTRPGVPAEERYKAVGGMYGNRPGLWVLASGDGVHWDFLRESPVITEGAFEVMEVGHVGRLPKVRKAHA